MFRKTRRFGPSVNLPTIRADFNDASKAIDPRITFTRASDAMRYASTGLVSTVATGVARAHANQEYNPTTLAARGFLLEEQRTNRALWCRDFTNAAWVKSNVTAALTATGADGAANSASTLTATAGNGTVLQTVTDAAKSRFHTCFVRRRTGNGTINMTMDNGTTWTVITPTSSWVRYSIPTASVLNPVFGFRIVTSGDEIDVDFDQIEDGSFATSPIYTTTAAATRLIDAASITGSNFTSIWNTEGSTIVSFQINQMGLAAIFPGVLAINDGTQNNSLQLVILDGTTDALTFEVHTSGVQRVAITGPTISANTTYKVGISYRSGLFNMAVNGTLYPESTAAFFPTVDRMKFGLERQSTYPLNGCIQSVAQYQTALSRTQLQALTA